MGLFGTDIPKRVTKREFEEIRQSLFADLEPEEWAEVERVFYGHLHEDGREAGITQEEFAQGMSVIRKTRAFSRLEESDLQEIEKEFAEHLED